MLLWSARAVRSGRFLICKSRINDYLSGMNEKRGKKGCASRKLAEQVKKAQAACTITPEQDAELLAFFKKMAADNDAIFGPEVRRLARACDPKKSH